MAKRKQAVPAAPKKRIVIDQEDRSRLEKWAEFFQGLSRRVELVRPSEERFDGLLRSIEAQFRKERDLEENYALDGWPTKEDVAFIVRIDSATISSVAARHEISDTYIFALAAGRSDPITLNGMETLIPGKKTLSPFPWAGMRKSSSPGIS